MPKPPPAAARAAKLRLILCFLHNNRLTEDCPLLLTEGGRVPETIAANFAAVSFALCALRRARRAPD